MAERATIWEQRAIDRAARIEKLVSERERLAAERERLRTVRGWLNARRRRPTARPEPDSGSKDRAAISSPGTATGERTTSGSTTRAHRPTFPAIQTVGITQDPLLEIVLGETRLIRLSDDPGALGRADLVIVEESVLERLDRSLRDRFSAWLDAPGRQPLAIVADPDTPGRIAPGPRDVVVDREWVPDRSNRSAGLTLLTSFDPLRWNPSIAADELVPEEMEGFDADFADDRFSRLVIATALDGARPWMTALAACGVPFIDRDDDVDDESLDRVGSLGRRRTYERRAPWIVARSLLESVGIPGERATPSVAGVLVSNRPERIVAAIEQFGRQSYERRQLVVGCHGFSCSPVAAAIERLAEEIAVNVLEFDAADPLGRCLNTAIESGGAEVVAKIDDDDHYGPGYLEDAIQAMRYAGAPLVGKGATFTYLESRDTTYLRRPATRERFYNGSPTGASLVFSRHLWEQVAFPHRTLGEDLAFVGGAKLLGFQPYATSPWEFVYHRAVSGNTWDAIDEVFLEGSTIAWEGNDPDRADLARP